MKTKYYSLTNILKIDAKYYVIFGERSNGKTFSVIERILTNYFDKQERGAIVRRWDEDFKKGRALKMFSNFIDNEERGNIIKTLSKGRFNSVKYMSGSWYMQHINEDTGEVDFTEETPFCYAFALNQQEHDKSTGYPLVTTILFDEFLTRSYYLPDEFIQFCNVISTIIRDRDNAKIFMCGNTITKYCPYFAEMGLSNVKKMKKGVIDTYTYGESDLVVAVEYSDFPQKKKKSDSYFAFNNPKLRMITTGEWELAIYPHLPLKYRPMNVQYIYFIKYDGEMLQCEIIYIDDKLFTYVHRKTTPVKDEDKYIVYQQEYDPRPNYRRRLTKPVSDIEKKIVRFFSLDKVFYQDNEVGELMSQYLHWCRTTEL
jgi:hypothetical protein